MTTTSPICTIKTRLVGTNNIQTFTNGTYELKPSRISVKKPLNGTHFLPSTSSSHDFGYPLKKRNPQLNPFYVAKNRLHQLANDHRDSTKQNEIHDEFSPTTPSFAFEPVSPGSTDETNSLSTHKKTEDQSKNDLTSSNGQHHANLGRSTLRQSSCSDVEQLPNGSRILLSMDDTDADESDNGQKEKSKKSRRLQKTRKPSNSSIQQIHPAAPVPRTNLRIEEQRRSSSNDEDENQESISRLSEIYFPNRRFKISASKKSQQLIFTTTTATTTTDDELTKQTHRVDILNQINGKSEKTNSTANESTLSSPNPAISAAPSVRKINRFQVKAIRKSQQAHILLANATAAKSSNDDDCSVPNERSISQIRPTIIDRMNGNTPTTDGESSRMNSDDLRQRTQNGQNEYHHVRFKVASHGKRESTVEEEKSSAPSTNNIASVTASVPPSSATPAQGEDDEEEEAVGKSPDGRFIKYAKEIGRGAFKTVYRGLDTETSVAVAWCELQDFAQFDKHERARFKEEAEMLKKLQHQNIVRFYDFWEETNPRTNKKVIILVTELMTSGSLKGYIRKFKGQKEEKRINVMKKWCRQILKGLAYLHSRNPPVIHRDLKCDNVFISSTTGCVKIGDLGLATFKTQTFAKSMRGTMEFMAPEMFDEKYDELVDIYSFGLCMLEMITGEYPYIECKGPTAVIKRVTAGLKPDCYYRLENEDVREVIDCCIRTKKEERLPVNELLQHSFFLDDNGLRIDLVRDTASDAETMIQNELIDFKLKITDKSKRKILWTEHEAIRFRYNLKSDVPEQIADELIQKKYIVDDDKKFVTQSIKDRLRSYQYEQIDRKAGVFTRDVKSGSANQTPLMGQTTTTITQAQQPTPQLPTTPLVVPPPVVPVLHATPNNSTVPDSSQAVVIKPTPELSQTKPSISNESVPIGPLPELSSTVSGSTRSLEVLDAALKKTFNKTNSTQNVNPTSNSVTDSSEPPTPVIHQDDSVSSRSTSHSISISDQQIVDDMSDIPTMDTITQACPSSNGLISQIQVQPQAAVILTSHPMKVSTNPSYITQTSQSLNFPINNGSQAFLPTTTSNDLSVKQALPSSSSSVTADGIENAQISVALPHTNESISNTILSDIPSTTPPQISGSLKQLDVLLAHTFKSSGKTSGTAYNSDTETTSTIPNPLIPLNDNHSVKVTETDSDDTKRKILELFNSSLTAGSQTVHSQPSTSSTLPPSTIKQARAQTTSIPNPPQFDPFISPERTQDQRETIIMKTPLEKSSSNDDTIVAASANDLSDIKSMIADLSKSLMCKMAVIEQKIDQHHEQTERINQLLTNTVLPSLFDITDIIHETSSHLDPRVRSKLEHIRTSVRTIKQQSDVQNLMEI